MPYKIDVYLFATDVGAAEERSLVLGVCTVLEPCLQEGDDLACFRSVLHDVFPAGAAAHRQSEYSPHDPPLLAAIREQLREMKMEENQQLVDKVLMCVYFCLCVCSCVWVHTCVIVSVCVSLCDLDR